MGGWLTILTILAINDGSKCRPNSRFISELDLYICVGLLIHVH